MIRLDDIVGQLDDYLDVAAFLPDNPFASWVPRCYEEAGIDPAKYIEARFLQSGNGLMLRNGEEVAEINTIVFASEETLRRAMERSDAPQLLVTHHPLDFETSDRGFLAPSAETLAMMRDRQVSLYSAHTPLDVHREISTGLAWARRLGLEELQWYCDLGMGLPYGVSGRLPQPMSLDDFRDRVAEIAEVDHVNSVARKQILSTIGVLAGGAVPNALVESQRQGCDAIVAGTYWNQCNNEYGESQRAELERLLPTLEISLVECSHFGSEAVVMRHDLLTFCKDRFGLSGHFVGQSEPWH